MISCDAQSSSPGPQWWEEAMHCRQSTRMLNLDVQVRHGPVAHPPDTPRLGSLTWSIWTGSIRPRRWSLSGVSGGRVSVGLAASAYTEAG